MASRGALHTFQAKLRALDFGLISLVNDLHDKFNEVVGEVPKVNNLGDIQAIEKINECLNDAIKGAPSLI